jgi:hypothetical protein
VRPENLILIIFFLPAAPACVFWNGCAAAVDMVSPGCREAPNTEEEEEEEEEERRRENSFILICLHHFMLHVRMDTKRL